MTRLARMSKIHRHASKSVLLMQRKVRRNREKKNSLQRFLFVDLPSQIILRPRRRSRSVGSLYASVAKTESQLLTHGNLHMRAVCCWHEPVSYDRSTYLPNI